MTCKCHIEIFLDGRWKPAARLSVPEASVSNGYRAPSEFRYLDGFVIEHAGRNDAAVSARFPVDMSWRDLPHWPAFALDLLPGGYARRGFCQERGIPVDRDGPANDWSILTQMAGNPPGNLRVAEAAPPLPKTDQRGFSKRDVIERRENFIEYAKSQGAPVSGAPGAQGDAPKFMLVVDKEERWHADAAILDRRVAEHWLVKYPRGKKDSDYAVLRNEAAYYKVVMQLPGLTLHEMPWFENDALFLPRFDRRVTGDGCVERFGLESLCSLSNVAEFGREIRMEVLCEAIARFSNAPAADIIEFVWRDVLNVAMGNTDNHARNTAMMRHPDGRLRLAPLYDFAPMILDDQGIARVCRWSDQVDSGGRPDWGAVAEVVADFGVDPEHLRSIMGGWGRIIETLPDLMRKNGVDDDLVDRLLPRIDGVTRTLFDAEPRVFSGPTP